MSTYVGLILYLMCNFHSRKLSDLLWNRGKPEIQSNEWFEAFCVHARYPQKTHKHKIIEKCSIVVYISASVDHNLLATNHWHSSFRIFLFWNIVCSELASFTTDWETVKKQDSWEIREFKGKSDNFVQSGKKGGFQSGEKNSDQGKRFSGCQMSKNSALETRYLKGLGKVYKGIESSENYTLVYFYSCHNLWCWFGENLFLLVFFLQIWVSMYKQQWKLFWNQEALSGKYQGILLVWWVGTLKKGWKEHLVWHSHCAIPSSS